MTTGRTPLGPCERPARGVILLVVLVIVAFLALLGTTFAYRMRADLSAVSAQSNDMQAELAAQAGIERLKLVLRNAKLPLGADRDDKDRWDDNPDAFRRVIVWTPGQLGGRTTRDQNVEPGQPAWRFSLIAPQLDEGRRGTEQSKFRYGVVDEASKLNLNRATRDQLVTLFRACRIDQLQENTVAADLPERLADCLLDWREEGDVPRPLGAKSSYYQTLQPPYRAKGKPLESVEELLLIKNFNGRILYGEDWNRNGHLDPNENDGDEGLFPPDNGDGVLNRGIYPFVTVYSQDTDQANDNHVRLNLNALNLNKLPEEMRARLEQEVRPEFFEFVSTVRKKGHVFKSVGEVAMPVRIVKKKAKPGAGGATRPAGQPGRGVQPNAPGGPGTGGSGSERPGASGDATGRPGSGGSSLPGVGGGDGRRPGRGDGGAGRRPGRDDETGDRDGRRPGRGDGATDRDNRRPGRDRNSGANDEGGEIRGGQRVPTVEDLGIEPDGKIRRRQQARRGGAANDEGGEIRGGQRVPTEEDLTGGRADWNDAGGEGRRPSRPEAEGGTDDRPARDGEGGDAAKNTGAASQPGDDEEELVEEIPTPVEAADMPVILDRFTVGGNQRGLINVNTAGREVLMTLPGVTEQEVDTILATRLALDDESKKTPAWLITRDAVSRETFAKIAPLITARSLQYTAESIGFADHVGTFKRIQVVLEMRGQVEQVLLWRDISSLGVGYPLREDEWTHGSSDGLR